MTLTAVEFLSRLRDSGVLPSDAPEIDAAASSMREERADATQIAEQLIDSGVLTRFQAEGLLADKSPPLVLGH